MHAGKRWTHAATRPMRHNPKSPKSQIGEWDSGELEAGPIQNDAPREKCEFYTLFGLALHSFCRSAASLPSFITRCWVWVPIFAKSRGGVSCHEPTGPCVARSVAALAEQ